MIELHQQIHDKSLKFLADTIEPSLSAAQTFARMFLFKKRLLNHLHFEDQHLSQIYKNSAAHKQLIVAPQNFSLDHDLIQKGLNQTLDTAALCMFFVWPRQVWCHGALAFQDLLNHHDAREKHHFYPTIAPLLSQDQQDLCRIQWNQELSITPEQVQILVKEISTHAETFANAYQDFFAQLQNNLVPLTLPNLPLESIFANKILQMAQETVALPQGCARLLKERQCTLSWINWLQQSCKIS